MEKAIALLVSLAALGAQAISTARLNVSCEPAADAVFAAYTNGFVTIAATDEDDFSRTRKGVTDVLPANLPLQLAVGPAPEDRLAAEAAVAAVTNNIPDDLRRLADRLRLTAPLVQRMLRRHHPGVTNEALYLTARAHPAVWRTNDFDIAALAAATKALTPYDIPLACMLTDVGESYRPAPLPTARPLVDYPDPLPERTYASPFGIGIVLRAPQRRRTFRFAARSWPITDPSVRFLWRVISPGGASGVKIAPFRGNNDLRPDRGFAEIQLDWPALRGRVDIAVFAQVKGGTYGPPSVISFCKVPNERRTYLKDGSLGAIDYTAPLTPPSPLFAAKNWIDSYTLDGKGRILGFTRKRKGDIFGTDFGHADETVQECHPDGMPFKTTHVRYTLTDGVLTWRETDETRTYKLGADPVTFR